MVHIFQVMSKAYNNNTTYAMKTLRNFSERGFQQYKTVYKRCFFMLHFLKNQCLYKIVFYCIRDDVKLIYVAQALYIYRYMYVQ